MFAHLHLHTEYSLLDGACAIDRLVDRLVELGQTSCAITDHGVMYGAVEFYQKCLKKGIHPVIGSEVYVCPDMLDKTSASRDYSHLILLCENQLGYKNLSKLVSEAFIDGFYYRPRVDYKLLRKYSEGLICLSACLSGDLPKLILAGRYDEAKQMAATYEDIYGKGNFYVELQDHSLPEDKQVLAGLLRLAREMDLPLVVTNDCHYINREDAESQEVLMCVQTGKTMSDESRMKMTTDELYVKSEAEMREKFPDFDDAFENTCLIAERCKVEFDFSKRHLPKFPLAAGQNADNMLVGLCREGLEKRYAPERADARGRLDYELDVIKKMGFADYFLIVWDFIKYAKDNGILVGPGRGSGAGSIVAYSLGITSIDPLKYNLLFERFLNPERVSMPDLDIDFDYERRSEVIDYVARRYGADHVAQIITFGTMAAKGVIRDVGRVLGMTYQQTDVVAKMVPFALDMTLDKAMSINGELRAAYENDPAVTKLIDTAKKLEGMPRHASTHAAGVLITSKPVCDYVPLQTNDDVITTQYPMGTLEALGLLKMDFLGLRTLTVIGDSLKMIAEGGGKVMTPEEIPLDDGEVYSMISSGDTDGVFQLESSGMRSFLMNMRPENFEDIIAAISLYRPGPMESIPRYIAGKRDPEKVRYLDERLKPILSVTYGCMVYQEQVMQIVRELAGYSLGRSDLVRRAMAKKKHDVMAKEKEYFINGKIGDDGQIEVPGAVRNGVPVEVAERLFEEMTAFASYAFNKSHAAAYGVVAVQTAWLKVHYKVEFMAAIMNSVTGNTDKVAFYIQYCRKQSIRVLPPDINRSGDKFSVDEGGIRFGLGAVKNVGHGAVAAITSQREKSGPFADLFDFINRLPEGAANKRCVESLIRAGALDSLPGHRAQKLAAYEPAMDGVAKSRKKLLAGQVSMFDALDMDEEMSVKPALPSVKEYPGRMLLSMEKENTGVYISGHPLDEYAEKLGALKYDFRTLSEICEGEDRGLSLDGTQATLGGMIAQVSTKTTKTGSIMAFAQLEDLYGVIEVLVFPKVYERIANLLEVNRVVLMSGKLSIREDEPAKLLLDSLRGIDEEDIQPPPPAFEEDRPKAGEKKPLELPDAMVNIRFVRPDSTPDKRVLYLLLDDDEQAERAARILMPTPGLIRVVFVMGEERTRYAAPRNLWVGENFDEVALRSAFGDDRVTLKEQQRGDSA